MFNLDYFSVELKQAQKREAELIQAIEMNNGELKKVQEVIFSLKTLMSTDILKRIGHKPKKR